MDQDGQRGLVIKAQSGRWNGAECAKLLLLWMSVSALGVDSARWYKCRVG